MIGSVTGCKRSNRVRAFDVVVGITLLVVAGSLTTRAAFADALEEDPVTENEIRAHATYLASAELEGRDAGHPGARLAADYLVRELKSYGLRPLGESWQHAFPMLTVTRYAKSKLTIAETTLEDRAVVTVPAFSGIGSRTAPVVMSTESEVEGRIVAIAAGENEREQALEAIGRGAVAVVLLRHRRVFDTRDVGRHIFRPPIDLEAGPAAWPEGVHDSIRNLIPLSVPVVAIARRARIPVLEAIESGIAVTLEVTQIGERRSTNVFGLLRGSDPAMRDEYVIVGAHYDHIGLDGKGEVLHGADDNASGVAAWLEVAEALASSEERPRRSILFIAWGAEEMGLVGSTAFCRRPPIELASVAACVNMDMIGRKAPDVLHVAAASDDLRAATVAAARRHGFALTSEGDPFHIASTDSHPFVQRGVPTVALTSGLHDDYNTVDDTADRLDIDKIARVARTVLALTRHVGNADARPTFTARPASDR